MVRSGEPFVGGEALALGLVNRHQLRTRYRAVFPNVYLPRRSDPTLEQRIAAAWLWSDRQGVIAGTAAAAVHGTKWIDADIAVELVYSNAHPPPGVLTRRDVLLDGEVMKVAGRAVTTPERTAFDIGRREERRLAVARLDALARASGFKVDDAASLALRHPGVRGLRRLEDVLDLVDAGAESPRETYLRLLLIDAGLLRPQTQIPVVTADTTYYLDMGWEGCLVAVE
ncbi:hypothetical protein MFM001_19150 [Mycobacterium sp. MFM001]|nr:hypothetical protein MFM001_19150 [Mycobacterium sp. MFM001]